MAPIRNCPKGARKAILDDIRSIGHLLANFHKNSLFLVALNLDRKTFKKLHRPNPFKGRYELAF